MHARGQSTRSRWQQLREGLKPQRFRGSCGMAESSARDGAGASGTLLLSRAPDFYFTVTVKPRRNYEWVVRERQWSLVVGVAPGVVTRPAPLGSGLKTRKAAMKRTMTPSITKTRMRLLRCGLLPFGVEDSGMVVGCYLSCLWRCRVGEADSTGPMRCVSRAMSS
jgi:hypothetical protein